jgi:hypothetical protein
VNLHARFQRETVGFGAPTGIDPHRFEVHVPPGNGGEIRIIEHYGVAAGAFGRQAVERCILKRKTWTAIRDDLKRHFNERLKENQMLAGAWKTGVNQVERLLGQELLVLCWAVEAAEPALIPAGTRNWLALRPEERWWLYAVTAAATGEAKHSEIGWRKALRFALTENPVREALSKAEPVPAPKSPKAKTRGRKADDTTAPLFPGFEEVQSPFLVDAPAIDSVQKDRNVGTILAEKRPLADRAGDPGAKDLGGSAKRAKGRSKSNANGAGVVLEGEKASRPRQSVRPRRAAAGDK